MELGPEAVREIAALARLDLDEEEVALFAEQLSACLRHFQNLQQVDSAHVEPTASVLPLRNVLREDVAGTPLTPRGSHRQRARCGGASVPRERGAGGLSVLFV